MHRRLVLVPQPVLALALVLVLVLVLVLALQQGLQLLVPNFAPIRLPLHDTFVRFLNHPHFRVNEQVHANSQRSARHFG
jgi:hypothetical protein